MRSLSSTGWIHVWGGGFSRRMDVHVLICRATALVTSIVPESRRCAKHVTKPFLSRMYNQKVVSWRFSICRVTSTVVAFVEVQAAGG